MGSEGFYPKDLQQIAERDYNALPESGTVQELISQIREQLSTYVDDQNNRRSFTGGNSHVQVGWKEDILVEFGKEDVREVINVGIVQWFFSEEGQVVVVPDNKYISNRNSSSSWETVMDDEFHRDIRWEISK